MDRDDGKMMKKAGAFAIVVVIAISAFALWTHFRGGVMRAERGTTTLFDGWVYSREDQKLANKALASAGLTDFRWDEGRLVVPEEKSGAYQSALATAGAYPKAPGELRDDAVRETSIFESDAKTRMRELTACSRQLERTIEQMRGIEFAAVGAKATPVREGFATRTVVTASVSVACREGTTLNADMVAAITLAAKHQLGIDSAANISVIDLKEGRSCLGVDGAVRTGEESALLFEKERIERYWRDKFLEAFSDIAGVRVSVTAELMFRERASSSSGVAQTAYYKPAVTPEPGVATASHALTPASVAGKFETLGDGDVPVSSDDLLPFDGGETTVPEPAPMRSVEQPETSPAGYAMLGNPRSKRATDLRAAPAPDGASRQTSGENAPGATLASARPALIQTGFLTGQAPTEDVAQPPRRVSPIAQTGGTIPADRESEEPKSASVELKSIVARIAVPRSYVQNAYRRVRAASGATRETWAEENADAALYAQTEERILAETQQFAISLLQPVAAKQGWSNEELERWILTTVYSDFTPAPVENAADARQEEHKSAYASETPVANPLPAPEQTPQERVAYVADTDGVVSEVLPTVAEERETPDEIEQDSDPEVPAPAEQNDAFSAQKLKELIQIPAVRNGVAAGCVALLFIVMTLMTVGRKRKNSESPEPVAKKGEAKTRREDYQIARPAERARSERNAGRSGSRMPEDGGFDLDEDVFEDDYEDEYDDELEDQLRRMGARRDARPSRGASDDRESDGARRQREEALRAIARYPERAAASLQRWARQPEASAAGSR